MRYGFTMSRVDIEDRTLWMASSNVLDGCVGQGESINEAMKELSSNEEVWLETAYKYDIPVPSVGNKKGKPYDIISNKMKSNCIVEYIKAKIRNPYISLVYIPASINTVMCPHIMWTDGRYDYDFGTDKCLKRHQYILHDGYIRKFKLGYAVRYREILYRRSIRSRIRSNKK